MRSNHNGSAFGAETVNQGQIPERLTSIHRRAEDRRDCVLKLFFGTAAKSDLANVAKQRLEAVAKLLEQQTAVADDLRDVARGLRDMALRLLQDFINAQKEISHSANI